MSVVHMFLCTHLILFLFLNILQLTIIVKWSPAPNLPINDELKEKIKLVMSRRYDAMTKVLNLSQFHLDERNL